MSGFGFLCPVASCNRASGSHSGQALPVHRSSRRRDSKIVLYAIRVLAKEAYPEDPLTPSVLNAKSATMAVFIYG